MTSAEKGSSSQKLPPYLQGVDDIEDADELRKFYYKIASDFYNNEMGLKGSPEQIDAGNKVMSDVYGFLGLSLSKVKYNILLLVQIPRINVEVLFVSRLLKRHHFKVKLLLCESKV